MQTGVIKQAERPHLGWIDIKNDIIFSPRKSLMRICFWRQQNWSLKACVCVCVCVCVYACTLLHDFLWVQATTTSMHRLSFQGPCLCFLIVPYSEPLNGITWKVFLSSLFLPTISGVLLPRDSHYYHLLKSTSKGVFCKYLHLTYSEKCAAFFSKFCSASV